MCLGALTIGDSVVRNVSYYIVAHASKFVRPGSFRIQSTILEGLPNVAFLTPDRQRVLIVLNDTQQEKKFAIRFGEHIAETSLPKMSVGTFVW
jgi:glucosylceramidase